MAQEAASKLAHVKNWFETPSKYVDVRRFDIQIRTETVKEFVGNTAFQHILDIGCGDGSLSVQLLSQTEKLTLLDLSSNMLQVARKKISAEHESKVDLVNKDLLAARLPSNSFDLVLCVGVLAHVDSVVDTLAEVARLVRPGGSAVIEFTDSFHFWTFPNVLYQNLLKLVRPAPYALNRLRSSTVTEFFRVNHLKTVSFYRYSLPPFGSGLFMQQEEMYEMTRRLFGSSLSNTHCWMGNEYLFHLRKES